MLDASVATESVVEKGEIDPSKILSDITVFTKYAKYDEMLGRRETWEELVARNKQMHLDKFNEVFQSQKDEEGDECNMWCNAINKAYDLVLAKKVLPSMRAMQFAGKPIEMNNSRIFNCSFIKMDHYKAFSETMFLLLSGCGVGYSVQRHHVEKLPTILKPNYNNEYPTSRRYLISDDIEGWAESIKILLKSYFFGTNEIRFDYRGIRARGMRLVTSGGKAPGFEPLRDCLEHIKAILDKKESGSKLRPIEVHDIQCHIANAVLAGGIRRAATISLFDHDEEEMLDCKSGEWWINNEQRGRANNTAVLLRSEITKEQFFKIWKRIEQSGCGEPGIGWTNDKEIGRNPCYEIALRTFCNLTEINASDIESQEDFNERVFAAALIGTLQASYTDFHYLRPFWREQTEEDALLGIGLTGIASNAIFKYNIEEAAAVAVEVNQILATKIGINRAKRINCVKPSGTTSLVLGTSSGVHAWHSEYYIRRMRINKQESIYNYLIQAVPELMEDCKFKPEHTAILSIPQKAPVGASTRKEFPLELLKRVKLLHDRWIKPAHIEGDDTHNVSVTVSIKENDWQEVGEWMWENRNSYAGISVLPYDGGTYVQAPFEDITEEQYNEMVKYVSDIDLTQVLEYEDHTNLNENVACAGGACEVR